MEMVIESPKQVQLTAKEWEFLGLLAEGLTNKAIAAKLFLQPKTIQDRSIRVYIKLGISSQSNSTPRVLAAKWYWETITKHIGNGNT